MFTFRRHIKSDHVTMIAEDEQYEGRWWIRDNPDKTVSGSLYITPKGIWLSLNGILGKSQYPSHFIDYDYILGMQFNGATVVLEQCREARGQEPLGSGYSRQDFIVRNVYCGIPIDSQHDIDSQYDLKFKKFHVNYTYLSDWLCNTGLRYPKED